MPRAKPFNRPRPARRVGRKLIIACEGRRTEVNYFHGIRRSLRLSTLQVLVQHPDATDPRSIVRAAIEYRRQKRREHSWTNGDEAWAVFDGDEHIDSDPSNWNDAIQLADANGIQLGISNPSFELWYLLHYQDQTGHLSRQQAVRYLKNHLPEYRKADVLWPMPLRELTDDAIRRAIELTKRADSDSLGRFCNPGTRIVDLVMNLLALSKDSVNR